MAAKVGAFEASNNTLLNSTIFEVFGTKPADETTCSTINVKIDEGDHLSFAAIRSKDNKINYFLVRTDHGSTMEKGIIITDDKIDTVTIPNTKEGTLIGFYGSSGADTLNNIGFIIYRPNCGALLQRNIVQLIIVGILILAMICCCCVCSKKNKKSKNHVATELALTDRSVNRSETDPAGTVDAWKEGPDAKFSAGEGAKGGQNKLDDM